MEREPQLENHDSGLREPGSEPGPSYDLFWAISGPQGIRVGWLILLFYCFFRLFEYLGGGIALAIAPDLFSSDATPTKAAVLELLQFVAMIGAGAIIFQLERGGVSRYYLRDARAARHLAGGFAAGFLALSALVGSLAFGGWLHFGGERSTATEALRNAVVWLIAFALVGCVEEGTFRCYGLWLLNRGVNFWWALALISGLCLYAFFFISGPCVLGVYAAAALGFAPCLVLHLRNSQSANFWQAAWATSTGFGFVHTLNTGENWIGIFAAAFIGFVFCVSVWATGSAWWAIGCHAAWDWAETYFYGTADSGFVAPGHLFTTSPAGNPLWSGGTDGPEGSLLIVPIVLLMMMWLVLVYRRSRPPAIEASAATQPLPN